MKNLKEEQIELRVKGKGFHTPEFASYRMRCNELFNKIADYITKQSTKNGCITDSAFYYRVYDAIHDGKFSLSAFKKNPEIINK